MKCFLHDRCIPQHNSRRQFWASLWLMSASTWWHEPLVGSNWEPRLGLWIAIFNLVICFSRVKQIAFFLVSPIGELAWLCVGQLAAVLGFAFFQRWSGVVPLATETFVFPALPNSTVLNYEVMCEIAGIGTCFPGVVFFLPFPLIKFNCAGDYWQPYTGLTGLTWDSAFEPEIALCQVRPADWSFRSGLSTCDMPTFGAFFLGTPIGRPDMPRPK